MCDGVPRRAAVVAASNTTRTKSSMFTLAFLAMRYSITFVLPVTQERCNAVKPS